MSFRVIDIFLRQYDYSEQTVWTIMSGHANSFQKCDEMENWKTCVFTFENIVKHVFWKKILYWVWEEDACIKISRKFLSALPSRCGIEDLYEFGVMKIRWLECFFYEKLFSKILFFLIKFTHKREVDSSRRDVVNLSKARQTMMRFCVV